MSEREQFVRLLRFIARQYHEGDEGGQAIIRVLMWIAEGLERGWKLDDIPDSPGWFLSPLAPFCKRCGDRLGVK
jgi:hypothetical protein